MTAAVASTAVTPTTDPRLAAFLAPDCPEVFHSVATPTAIWQADPYDVETIHAEARAAFERLLNRGGRLPAPPSGAVLVLMGEAGSGKTHLMRAFRTRAHGAGLGYCAYLQMTTEASNYARYILTHLIDGLEQPYSPDGVSRTGLARLSAGLFEEVPGITEDDRVAFGEADGDAAALADEYADRLYATDRFRSCDLELLRVMLHLERDDPRVRSRALMWLRCQDMRSQDREWIGGAVPRADDADPLHMLRRLARLVDAADGVPLVLLVDQLEDMANQSAPVERFRQVVDAITAFTDQIPNAVVVLACLEDYFKESANQLTKAKQDRLVRDPEPLRLPSNRAADEIGAMAVRRLAYLYDEAGADIDPANELYPFREAHLGRLGGMRARDALDYLRRHQQRCILAGRWLEPETAVVPAPTNPGPTAADDLTPVWNDFHSAFHALVPDGEDELARVLADAVRSINDELPDGVHFGDPQPDGRYLEVETNKPDGGVDRLLVAVCNKKAQGGGLGKQLNDVEKRIGDFPVALVRTTYFPSTKGSKVVGQIAALIKRDGRRVVVADADWRRMLAFEAFRKQHGMRPDFGGWQKAARPLGELDSLQKILRISTLTAAPRPVAAIAPPPAPEPLPGPPPLPPTPARAAALLLGRTKGLNPTPVTFEPDEFTQHAAFLGGSGSGKTTAALNLIEQLLVGGIPAVLLDRKGDLCRYADPAAWDRPLADPARTAARQQLREKLDVAVFTPGEPNGRPLALPVVPPGFDQLSAADRERFAQYAAGALGSMIGFKTSDADKGQRAILAKAIEVLAATAGTTITVPVLRDVIDRQDDALLAAIGGGYPEKYFTNLAQRLLTLELNNRQLMTGGEQLDIDALLGTGPHASDGRVRLSILSTRFLGDAAKVDFWVSQLLVAISRWCARSPRPHLQAIFLFDEADVYLPAMKKPATKEPMEDLLKRARSAGVGILLATQSPGEFDYRCKENVRTWFIGRVKEPRAIEKLKPMLAARAGAADKLAGQAAGEFLLVRESSVASVCSDESLVRTEQMPEERIAELARGTVDG
jgi:hypothetical protein